MLSRHMENGLSHLVQNEQHTATQAVAEYECGYEHELGGLMACIAIQVSKGWSLVQCNRQKSVPFSVLQLYVKDQTGTLESPAYLLTAKTTPSVARPTNTILLTARVQFTLASLPSSGDIQHRKPTTETLVNLPATMGI